MKSVIEYLENSAARYPDKTAFADEAGSCTFWELLVGSRIVGTALAQIGVERRPVPVMMEKGVLTIQILMGIVQAGGFYVVLDASHPVYRLQQILDTLAVDVLVVSEENREKAAELDFQGTRLSPEQLLMRNFDKGEFQSGALNEGESQTAISDEGQPPASSPEKGELQMGASDAGQRRKEKVDAGLLEAIRSRQCDMDPLYIMFTSGSTGVPKGVLVSHRSVIDFMTYFTELFGFTEKDVIGNQAPWDFDVSVKDIYAGLKTGAEVQILPRRLFSFPQLLIDFLEKQKVTSLTWAVSALCILSTLNGFAARVPSYIRRVMFSGEVMPIGHLNYWRKYLPEAMFVNLYGPTEITCNCTYYILDREFSPGDLLPIGRPFPNERVFLLDEADHEIRTPGKVGELCVAGTALALGYYRNPEQTARAFVQNPLNQAYPEQIYRTGDLGCYNENGELCFASRRDHQIKHMGHRIELGEIECALEKAEGLTRGCCFFDQEKNRIVCCYQGSADRRQLSRELGAFLPAYMVPNVFFQMDALPLNKNGKIDRKALQESYRAQKTGKRRRTHASAE